MITRTATADNYDFEKLKTDQNSIFIWLVNNTASAGSTLSDFFIKPQSTPRKLHTFPQIREVDYHLKTWQAALQDLHDVQIKEHDYCLKTWQAPCQDLCDELIQDAVFTRPTTPREQLMGEIRSWGLLEANWDGEGADAPIDRCIKAAVSFIRLLPENITLPEPMLHASGNTGLFWEDDGFYADIEFLDNGRTAYYIEQNGDKHKGAINFNSKNLPPIFSVLLGS